MRWVPGARLLAACSALPLRGGSPVSPSQLPGTISPPLAPTLKLALRHPPCPVPRPGSSTAMRTQPCSASLSGRRATGWHPRCRAGASPPTTAPTPNKLPPLQAAPRCWSLPCRWPDMPVLVLLLMRSAVVAQLELQASICCQAWPGGTAHTAHWGLCLGLPSGLLPVHCRAGRKGLHVREDGYRSKRTRQGKTMSLLVFRWVREEQRRAR